jgi:2-keto-4-pentenoate hydratase
LEREATREAARVFAEVRASGALLHELPETSRPKNAREAYAIQLETIARLNDDIAGWKVAFSDEYELLFGALLRSRVFADGAAIPSGELAMIGVEAEIAFRFDRPAPPRELVYERDEIIDCVTAFPAIEILDSRFKDYHGASVIDRAADFMSNSAFVVGQAREDWRAFDLAKLEARLSVDDIEIVRLLGGHAAGDPFNPAIALVNKFRDSTGIPAGSVVTTGTYTGLQFVKKNSSIHVQFIGFGGVNCRFVP